MNTLWGQLSAGPGLVRRASVSSATAYFRSGLDWKPIIRARWRWVRRRSGSTVQLLALGLNHETAPLALRERVAFVPDEVGSAIASLRDRLAARDAGQVSEAAIVSTCNRTELYCAVEEPKAAGIALAEFIASAKHLDSSEIRKASYVLPQSNAVRHAFRVAS